VAASKGSPETPNQNYIAVLDDRSMSQEITRRLAIMFTDLVGYSSMMGVDEHQAIDQLENYRAILCPIIETHQGKVIEFAGDSVFARFDTAAAAADAGLEIQQTLQRYNDKHSSELRSRIGVHFGDVLERDGHIYGDDINIAARLEPLGDPQGVCISETVYHELNESLRNNCVAYGRPLLKNITERLQVFHLFREPVSNGKRLSLHLRRAKHYLGDHPTVSAPLGIVILAVSVYLLVPVFFKPASAVHYVELGEIRNLSPDDMPEYYTIGIADEIRTRLKEIPSLYVSLAEEEVAAEVILTGSMQQLTDHVRISYQIVRRDDGVEIGGARMDGKLENMLSMQRKLANRVATELASKLDFTLEKQKTEKRRVAPEAYQYYLQAREYAKRPDDKQTLNASISLYRKSVLKDNKYAAAYAGLCEAYWGMYLLERHGNLVEQAQQACLKAEILDADLAEVQVALGAIYNGRGRLQKAIVAYNKAIQLEPRNIDAFVGLADVYTNINKPKLAEQTYRRAIELQPGNWEAWVNYGRYQFNAGQFNKAEKSFRRVVALTPDSIHAYSNLGAALLYLGDFKQAAQVFDEQSELKPSATLLSNAATMYYYYGDYERAARMYEEAIALAPEQCLFWVNLSDALHQLPRQNEDARNADSHALELCSNELEVNPEDHEILLLKSKMLARMGRIDEALAAANVYKSFNYSDPQDQLNLALVFLRSGDLGAVKDTLEQAIQLGYPHTLILAEPEFKPVRDEAWFKSLVDENRRH